MDRKQTRKALWLGAMTALLLLATVIRVWRLDAVPPGLTHDEAANGHDSAAILRGVHRIYFPVGYGREPLYNYSVALVTLGLGQGLFTLRLTTVIWSLVTWISTVCLARRWWGRRAALLTGAALTLSFWPLMMARVGLRAPTLAALIAASVLAYDHALRAEQQRTGPRQRATLASYTLAGILLGASFYTYMASRGMPLLYLVFILALWGIDRHTARRATFGTLAVLIVAALVGLPLFAFLRAHPALEVRIGQLAGALQALVRGDWRPFLQNMRDSLPMYLWRADPYWLYNVAGRPVLEPFLAAAWSLGLVLALAGWRDRRSVFVLLWLGAGSAPAFLTEVAYNTLHAIAALPATFLLVGFGLDQTLGWVFRPHRRRYLWPAAVSAIVAVGLLASGANALHSYFAVWGQERNVRVAYQHAVVALGRELLRAPEQVAVISTMYPGEFHDPYVGEVILRGQRSTLRWVDGRGALFFPHQPAKLYLDPQAALSPPLSRMAQAQPEAPLRLRDDDIPSRIEVYAWKPDAAWRTAITGARTETWAAPGDPPPNAQLRAVRVPVSFSNVVTLWGYQVEWIQQANGSRSVELLTLWEVTAPHAEELVMFAHLLDSSGTLLAQVDRLDAPNWQWQPGDRFAHLHRLELPEVSSTEASSVAVGFYQRPTLERLALTGPAEGATRLLLSIEPSE